MTDSTPARFALADAMALLSRTPATLDSLLRGLPDWWTSANEGPDTWNPFDVVGHLIHGERTDWMARADIILGGGGTFATFDRLAQFRESEGKSLVDLIGEFRVARAENLDRLRARNLSDADLDRTGIHPKFGSVTARQLLATWTVHDLDHVMQIARVMAKQIGLDVGPWVEYLKILRSA